jgi:hypothetical protein
MYHVKCMTKLVNACGNNSNSNINFYKGNG